MILKLNDSSLGYQKKYYYAMMIISTLVLFIVWLIFWGVLFRWKFHYEIIVLGAIGAFYIFLLWILLFIHTLYNGNICEKEGIRFYNKFHSNYLSYSDIECIFILNADIAYGRGVSNVPWIGVIGESSEEVINLCKNRKGQKVLTANVIRYELQERIGFYYFYNFLDFFKKETRYIKNYGFVWNNDATNLLHNYKGEYYIAASVVKIYEDKIKKSCELYGIRDERIHILDDSVNGTFRRW